MRALGILLAVILTVQFTCWLPGIAAPATFSTDANGVGGAQAEIPVNKIGALLLADATAFLNNSVLEVRSNSPDSKGQTLLQATVLNTQMIGSKIHGIAFFTGGTQLGGLCKSGKPERVKTAGGDVLTGAISDVTAAGLSVGGKRVSATSVACIDSPCAYEFDVSTAAGEGTGMKFSQCRVPATSAKKEEKEPKQPKVSSSSGEHSTRARVIVTCVLIAAVATAIAVPVAVACGRKKHHHNNNVNEFLVYRNLLTPRPQTTNSEPIQNPFGSSSSSSSP